MIRRWRSYPPPVEPGVDELSPFFCKYHKLCVPRWRISFCHNIFGVFRPQIHAFWGPVIRKSQFTTPFLIFVNIVLWPLDTAVVIGEPTIARQPTNQIALQPRLRKFAKTLKSGPFLLSCVLCLFFFSLEFRITGEISQNMHSIWSIWIPIQCHVSNLHPHGVTTLCYVFS